MSELAIDISEYMENMPDEVVAHLAFSMPWQYGVVEQGGKTKDEDGFDVYDAESFVTFEQLQHECWKKFNKNPHISSYVRDYMGALCGRGFSATSDNLEIHDFLEEIFEDPRNRLYSLLPKYAARSEIEGELFLVFTVHDDGFVEIDFQDPGELDTKGTKSSGILFHPGKPSMPLWYFFRRKNGKEVQIPSIYIAYYPELLKLVSKNPDFDMAKAGISRRLGMKHRKIGNFRRFIVNWDRGYLTIRNISHIRTVLEWLNHYENLKKYEIDHKKSSGSYLWVAKFTEPKYFKQWLSMTDEQRKKTGLMAKKVPGGTLMLPPGVELECKNPSLTNISDKDTDIMHMVSAGLNTPEDMLTGQSSGRTFASVKASRGPTSDRIGNEVEYFRRFLLFDFFRAACHLRIAMGAMKDKYKVKQVVDFQNKKEITREINLPPWKLIDLTFPTSEVSDIETVAKALLGVKHGSVVETLGISRESVAKRLGFGDYKKQRLIYATEEEVYPELPMVADAEAAQEEVAEKGTADNKSDKKTKNDEDKKQARRRLLVKSKKDN